MLICRLRENLSLRLSKKSRKVWAFSLFCGKNLELRIYSDNELIKIIKLKHNQMTNTYNVKLKIKAVNPKGDTWAQATYGIANTIIE